MVLGPPAPHRWPTAAEPRRLLLVGPPGCGKSRRALDAFHDGVRRFGPDACLLVLPTYGEVEHQKRLAVTRRDVGLAAAPPTESGAPEVRGILDRSYATFTSLGERWVKDFRVRDLPTRRERDLLVEEALRAVDAPAFREVVDRPGLRSRVLRLVKDFKQSGEEPAALRARLTARVARLPTVTSREAFEAFLRVWEAYDALLQRAGRRDHEDLLRTVAAAARVSGDAADGLRLLVVDGFEDLSAVETALLKATADAVTRAGGRVIVTLPGDGTATGEKDARPALFRRASRLRAHLTTAAGFVETRCPGFLRARAPTLVAVATRLFADDADGGPRVAPDEGPVAPDEVPVAPDGGLRTLVGADPADEAERIAREVLRMRRAGEIASWREVGVVARRLDGVGPMFVRRFAALGIPARLSSGGSPLTSVGVVRALRGPLDVLCADVGASDGETGSPASRALHPLLLLEYLRWRALASGAPFPVVEVDRLDQRMRRGAMPRTWEAMRSLLLRVEGEVARVAADLDALRTRAHGAGDAATAWSVLEEAVTRLTPLPEGGAVDPGGRPLDPEGDRRLVRARAARTRLLDLVRDGRRLAPLTQRTQAAALRDVVDDLWRAADEACAEPTDPRLDTVHLLDVEEARHWELPIVFVTGLVDGAFPLRPREDAILRDEDRARLVDDEADALRGATLREAEDDERRFFLVAATRARRRLYLCRALSDDAGKEREPSPFLGAVDAALGRGADDPNGVRRVDPDVRRIAPRFEAATCRGDLVRAACAALGGWTLEGSEPERAFAVALARTGGRDLTSLLGRAGRFARLRPDPLPPASVAAFAREVAVTSATAVEAGAACLHRFFLARVLRLDADASPLLGRALDARLLGEWLHEVLRRAVASPDAAPEALAAAVIHADDDRLDDSSAHADAIEELARVVTLFRLREGAAATAGFAPRVDALEWAFQAEVPAGGPTRESAAFALRGKVDRVDLGPPGSSGRPGAIVVDYKSGTSRVKDGGKALVRGEDLQLALYAGIVEAALGVEVVGLELYAARRRGRSAVGVASAGAALLARCGVDGGKPTVVAPEAFRDLLASAIQRATDVVDAVRGARHDKNPVEAKVCRTCSVRAVCRPDPEVFEAARSTEDGPTDHGSPDGDPGDDAGEAWA